MDLKTTPWSSWAEWRWMYDSLYSGEASRRGFGLELMEVWRLRGGVPHGAESTATLVSLMCTSSSSCVRLALAMAVVRCVNGVVDREQKALRARSVHKLAEGLGLASWIVELRHAATHNDLPSLEVLRAATTELLVFFDESYWRPQLARLEAAEAAVARELLRGTGSPEKIHPTTYAAFLVPAFMRHIDDDHEKKRSALANITDAWPAAPHVLADALANHMLSTGDTLPGKYLETALSLCHEPAMDKAWRQCQNTDDLEPKKRLAAAAVANALATDFKKRHKPNTTDASPDTIDEAERQVADLAKQLKANTRRNIPIIIPSHEATTNSDNENHHLWVPVLLDRRKNTSIGKQKS